MTVGNHTLPSDLLETCTEGLFYCISEWANEVTMGWFWVFLLIGFMVVLGMGTMRFGGTRAFGFASFGGMLASMWLSILGLMDWGIASIFILIGAIGLASMILSEKM